MLDLKKQNTNRLETKAAYKIIYGYHNTVAGGCQDGLGEEKAKVSNQAPLVFCALYEPGGGLKARAERGPRHGGAGAASPRAGSAPRARSEARPQGPGPAQAGQVPQAADERGRASGARASAAPGRWAKGPGARAARRADPEGAQRSARANRGAPGAERNYFARSDGERREREGAKAPRANAAQVHLHLWPLPLLLPT